MKTTKDIKQYVLDIKYYADKIYAACERQLDADYMQQETDIDAAVKHIGLISEEARAMKTSCELINLSLISIEIANDNAKKAAEQPQPAMEESYVESYPEESTVQTGPDQSGD